MDDKVKRAITGRWDMTTEMQQQAMQAFLLFRPDVAEEFAAFREIFRKEAARFDPSFTGLPPFRFEPPTTPPAQYAVAVLAAAWVTEETFPAAVAYMEKLPPEYGVIFMYRACRKNWKLTNTPIFHAWARKHADLVC